jgi:hypothetical protein
MANYFKTPIARFGFRAIFGVMSDFIVIETHSFKLPTSIPLGLVLFQRNLLLNIITFGFKA